MNRVKPVLEGDLDRYENSLKRYGVKYHLLFKLGYSTGLRVSDLRLLKYGDVVGKKPIKIKESKTGKERIIKLTKQQKDYFRRNMDYSGMKLCDYICPGRYKGTAMSRVQIYRVMRKAGEDIGLIGFGTHTMRKSFAINLFKETKDVKVVQEALNHRFRDTTLVSYILSGIDFDLMSQMS